MSFFDIVFMVFAFFYVLFAILFAGGECVYMVHTPECKFFLNFVAVGLWFALALCLICVGAVIQFKIWTDAPWWAEGLKLVLAAFFILRTAVSSFKRTVRMATHTDYDAIMGKANSHPLVPHA